MAQAFCSTFARQKPKASLAKELQTYAATSNRITINFLQNIRGKIALNRSKTLIYLERVYSFTFFVKIIH